MKKLIVTALLISGVYIQSSAQSLLISELLYQPLSGEAEYVELYNNTDHTIDLRYFKIIRWTGDSLGKNYQLPNYRLAPHDYVVLTKDILSVINNYNAKYLDKVIECNLPTYPNNGGRVVLADVYVSPMGVFYPNVTSAIIDQFDYSPSMQSRLLRDKAGVALERRSFERPTNEASNWFSAASTAGYGTPGYANSQSSEYLAEEASFVFSSTLISPDGDDYQDVLEIDYQLENGNLSARVDLYDGRGTLVRRLLNNALLGTHGSLSWDGRGEDGRPLPQGQYIVQVTLYDTGGTLQVFRRAVAIITPPPLDNSISIT
ncbi:MAG: lamin tail domain-containing protein [Bacteroidales bacterium]|nr:lamin tail domain-containing protein [Bacteroidales bacterium]